MTTPQLWQKRRYALLLTQEGTVFIKMPFTATQPMSCKKSFDIFPLFHLQYEASIQENTYGVEVMRLKTNDLDLANTENWQAEFDIIKGNEVGYFSIKTDPLTNDGILMLDKVKLWCSSETKFD